MRDTRGGKRQVLTHTLAAKGDGSLFKDPLFLVFDFDVVGAAGRQLHRQTLIALPLQHFDGEGLGTAAEVAEPAARTQALDGAQVAREVVGTQVFPHHAGIALPGNVVAQGPRQRPLLPSRGLARDGVEEADDGLRLIVDDGVLEGVEISQRRSR